MQPGVITLARRARLPVQPVGIAARKAWVLGSWDAFMVPRPFTRVVIAAGKAMEPQDLASGTPADLCAELKRRLGSCTELAQQAVADVP